MQTPNPHQRSTPPRDLRAVQAHLAGLAGHLEAIGRPAEARVIRDAVADLGRVRTAWVDLWYRDRLS